LPIGRRILLQEEDAEILLKSIPMIEAVNAGIGRYLRLRNGTKTSSTYCEGVFPDFEYLRRTYHAAGGRFLNMKDIVERKRVIFLGSVIAKELFDTEAPIGETVYMDGLPFTIVGVMPKKLQTSMNYGPDDRRAIVPFTTFKSIYGDRYLDELIIKPARNENSKKIISEIRRILSKKYKFDPTDERALPMWDFIEQEKIGARVFLGINIFLGVIGGMTLIIAGIGVANIMYVVVKERTQEIGIKRAIGAKRRHITFQFIFESLLISLTGGLLGLAISLGIIKLVWSIPAEEGAFQFLGRPLISNVVVIIAIGLLTLIGLLAGLFPARKAANVDPVEALRYE